MYPLLALDPNTTDITPYFAEGVLLAANCAVKPLDPDSWLGEIFGELESQEAQLIKQQLQAQYSWLKRGEWAIWSSFSADEFADFAEGFMTLWPTIEEQWGDIEVLDSTARMLQALLTTLMLAIDESQTQVQMMDAGVEQPPSLSDLLPQFSVMVNEVAMAADEVLVGLHAQRVNPYKDVGRNDDCPCGSGQKFKACCGQ
jgi:uncharacterized protein